MESKKESDMFRIEWCDRPIVRVLGTVMTRDDNLGGWLPYLTGGQSKVGIHESVDGRRFRIYGWRINDKKVTLDCHIQRNMVFHETIGTFHHWKVGDKKMGLTFYTPAEARSFNRGVRVALENLSRIAENNSSSGSSSCSRLSDDHQSFCTSPASSTGSSSPYEIGPPFNGKTLSTSSTSSSSSSKHATRSRRSPSRRTGKQFHRVYSSTSSSNSTQNRIGHSHQPVIASVVTAAPTLSLLSSATSPLFCETSSSDLGQPHFRWPLPQQQSYSTTLTFLNRPIAKEGSRYERSALTQQPAAHSALSVSREADMTSISKPQALLLENGSSKKGETAKVYDTAIQLHRDPLAHRRESPHSRYRGNRHSYRRQGRGHHHSSRPRLTKTPHLDILERQRDLKPTEPNSYVLFSSSKPPTTVGSQGIGSQSLTAGVTTALGGIRSGEYKPLGQMTLGYPYHPMLSTMYSASYHPPQSGTLSIMASTADAPQLYSRSEMFYSSNIDCIKDDAICYEPGSSLISGSLKKSKHKRDYFGDSKSDIGHPRHSEGCLCCPCYCSFRSKQHSTRQSRYKEDLAERSKCRHCHEMFNHELNKPGSCGHAPDRCLNTINRVTCMFCVNSLFYHCCRDDEGDYDDEPCSCSSGHGGGRSKLFRRWSALAALSIIFPCLCLYPPLRACHGCGVACHCCGGKHQVPFSSNNHTEKTQQQAPSVT